jgi:hypothetical protein
LVGECYVHGMIDGESCRNCNGYRRGH